MTTITIPKKITKGTDLVVIPRKEYEKLLSSKKVVEFVPTAAEKRAIARGRKNFKKGNYLTIDELKDELGFTG